MQVEQELNNNEEVQKLYINISKEEWKSIRPVIDDGISKDDPLFKLQRKLKTSYTTLFSNNMVTVLKDQCSLTVTYNRVKSAGSTKSAAIYFRVKGRCKLKCCCQ